MLKRRILLVASIALLFALVLWCSRGMVDSDQLQSHSLPAEAATAVATLESGYLVASLGDIRMMVNESSSSRQTSIPFMGDYTCSDKYCTEFLSEKDSNKVRACSVKGAGLSMPLLDGLTGECHFMDGGNRKAVVLMSYPGSGNTWVRGLLEQATGICTGSVYCDRTLKSGGFHGESLKSGAVLVAKSHTTKWASWTDSGILVVRNPLDANVADWNRQNTKRRMGHVGIASKHLFVKNPEWDRFVHHFAQHPWTNHFKWLIEGIQTGRPVLVVRYEDLQSDTLGQVKRMLNFLKVPYSDEALKKRMNKDFEAFHRAKTAADNFDHYTPEQRAHILELVSKSIEMLKAENIGTFGLEDYLQ